MDRHARGLSAAARAHRACFSASRPACRSRSPARRCWCGCARPASISAPSGCSRWSARPTRIKFLWAPLVDALDVPMLSRLLGRRRGWLVFSQLLLMAAIVFLALHRSGEGAADGRARRAAGRDRVGHAGHRHRRVPRREPDDRTSRPPAWRRYVAAYRVGMLVSTAGALFLVTRLRGLRLRQDAALDRRLSRDGGAAC